MLCELSVAGVARMISHRGGTDSMLMRQSLVLHDKHVCMFICLCRSAQAWALATPERPAAGCIRPLQERASAEYLRRGGPISHRDLCDPAAASPFWSWLAGFLAVKTVGPNAPDLCLTLPLGRAHFDEGSGRLFSSDSRMLICALWNALPLPC